VKSAVAGAGCVTLPTETWPLRAMACGCVAASENVSTGAKQASEPSNTRHHSSRVRVRNSAAKRAPQCGPTGAIVLIRQRFGGKAQPHQQLIVKLRLDRADCDVLPSFVA